MHLKRWQKRLQHAERMPDCKHFAFSSFSYIGVRSANDGQVAHCAKDMDQHLTVRLVAADGDRQLLHVVHLSFFALVFGLRGRMRVVKRCHKKAEGPLQMPMPKQKQQARKDGTPLGTPRSKANAKPKPMQKTTLRQCQIHSHRQTWAKLHAEINFSRPRISTKKLFVACISCQTE